MTLKEPAVLLFVTQQYFKPFPFIPKGHKTICSFEIKDSILLQILNKLPVVNGWDYHTEFVELFGNKHV